MTYEHREAATRYRHLFSRDELATLAQDAGFTNTRILRTSDPAKRGTTSSS